MNEFLNKTAHWGMAVLFMVGGSVWAAQTSSQSPVAEPVVEKDAYVEAVPPSSENTVAYMTLVNQTDKPIQLVKASSPMAKAVELHQHLHQNGMMKMVKLDSVEIPAHGQIELKPMGLHLMLIGLKPSFQKQQAVFLKLFFSNHSHLLVHAPVRKAE